MATESDISENVQKFWFWLSSSIFIYTKHPFETKFYSVQCTLKRLVQVRSRKVTWKVTDTVKKTVDISYKTVMMKTID